MNPQRQTISGREWRVAGLVALAFTGLTLLPYMLGYLTVQEGSFFTGLIMNPEDSQTYFAKILQGYDGHLLYTIPFTSEPHQGALVGVFYVWLGYLGRVLDIAPALLWQLSRLATSFFLCLVTFKFVAAYLSQARTRWTAYLLSLFGSGLGWLLFLFNQPYWLDAFPVDFKQPGAHLFFTALTFPHVAFGTALTLISIRYIGRAAAVQTESRLPWGTAVAAGVVNLVLGVTYPFLIYLSATVALLYWVYLVWQARRILWRASFFLFIMFVIPLPLFIYYAYTLQVNPIFRSWDVQAGTPALPWPHYLVAYGLMLALALVLWYQRPAWRSRMVLLWLWIAAVVLLLYAPLRPQRRFVQGVQVPLAILASAAFDQIILPRLERLRLWRILVARPRYSTDRLTRFAIMLFLLFMSLSNIYVLASVSTSSAIQQPDGLFRPVPELAATAWLRQNSGQDSIILGAYSTGNYVAAHSGRSVVLGHWAETANYEAKLDEVALFFAAETEEEWRQQMLERYQIDYVWFGPRERALGAYDPRSSTFLAPVYEHQTITIFAVQNPSPP